LRSSAGLLRAVRQQLEKKGLSAETCENLIGLLSALMTTISIDTKNEADLIPRLAEAFTDHGALLTLIQQQAAELDALKRITFNLTSSLELQVVLDGVVREAMQLVQDANDAHIYLYQNQKIVFGASLMADGSSNRVYAEPRPDGLTYQVARTREMIVVEDMQEHPLYQDIAENWSGSIIGIPLKMGDRVIGVMNLVRTRRGEFTQAEIRLLTLLADQATIAIINARLHQAVSQQARSDVLTSLPNRRALDERLDEEILRSTRLGCTFCVIMMDLDGFKQVNDSFGHDVGDDVLRQVARSLQETLRASDFLARYGGDELTLVLSETDLAQAQVVVEKINANLANLAIPLPDGSTKTLGISGGIAIHPTHATNAPGLIRAADEALYQAKRSGGNCFLVAQTGHA
jgi:diguanylate cyclase (GGDEF)-like protein